MTITGLNMMSCLKNAVIDLVSFGHCQELDTLAEFLHQRFALALVLDNEHTLESLPIHFIENTGDIGDTVPSGTSCASAT